MKHIKLTSKLTCQKVFCLLKCFIIQSCCCCCNFLPDIRKKASPFNDDDEKDSQLLMNSDCSQNAQDTDTAKSPQSTEHWARTNACK